MNTAAAPKMRLDLLRGGRVVDIADEDAARVDVFLVFGAAGREAERGRLGFEILVHAAQFGGFGFHFADAGFHCLDFVLGGETGD